MSLSQRIPKCGSNNLFPVNNNYMYSLLLPPPPLEPSIPPKAKQWEALQIKRKPKTMNWKIS